MINELHAYFHSPTRGWDPVDESYAEDYGAKQLVDAGLVARFEGALGGFGGKRVVDVASGPGHYSLEFARRGALVTCLDVSRSYLKAARQRIVDAGFDAIYALGYLDHICKVTPGGYDGVFCNIAWNYCMNDFSFARSLVRAVVSGGKVFVRETNSLFEHDQSAPRRLVYAINRVAGIKVGHPHPPHGRIAAAFERQGCEIETDYSDPTIDIVVATRT